MEILSKLSKTQMAAAQLALLSALILVIFWAGTSLTPGWGTWFLCLPAWTVLAVTAAARIKDITALGKRWFFRRLGLILVGAGILAAGAAPIMGYTNAFPTWRGVFFAWGFALTWLTTPEMPPWWPYISGEWKLKKGQQA